jgi:uncharacterized protein
MAPNFASLAFTPEIKALQDKHGSRHSYERLEKHGVVNGLSKNEIEFIGQQDSLYMASMGENGFPYIQHRGGPKGFVKVLDGNTIAFIDFSGNKQYISVGNLVTNKNVSIIMVDYPSRSRLKLYAKAEVFELKDRPDLLKRLSVEDYIYKPERMMVFTLEAFDWNCPQHITPRYTEAEIEEALLLQREYIKKLEQEIKALKSNP